MGIRFHQRRVSGPSRVRHALWGAVLTVALTASPVLAQYPGGEEPPPEVGGVVENGTAFPRGAESGPLPFTGLELTLFLLALAAVAAAYLVRRHLRTSGSLQSGGV